ncbi:hypothetical protein GCM10027203_51270 [Nonomuraea fastidiosa]
MAISSGPAAAASPSPRFVSQLEASNHRKPVPSRAGSTRSITETTSAAAYVGPLTGSNAFSRARDTPGGPEKQPHIPRTGNSRNAGPVGEKTPAARRTSFPYRFPLCLARPGGAGDDDAVRP